MTQDQRKTKGKETKHKILEHAYKLACKDGLHSLRIKKIAKAVDMSEAGILKPFSTKEELQQELVNHIFDEYEDMIFNVDSDSESPYARLLDGLQEWLYSIEWNDGGCPICAISMEYRQQEDPVGEIVSNRMERFLKKIEKAIEESIKNRDVPKHVDPSEATLQFFNHILVTNWRVQCLRDTDCIQEADEQLYDIWHRIAYEEES